MEIQIFFEDKCLLLTDDKTKCVGTFFIGHDKAHIEQAINAIAKNKCVVLYDENVEELLKDFKAQYIYIEAAGGFIQNECGEFLFMERRGKWDLPKGKLESGETPEIAAIREVQEETGLQQVERHDYRCSTWHTYELHGKQILKQTYWYNMTATKNQASQPQLEEDITVLKWIAPKYFSHILNNTFPSIIRVIECQ